MSPSTNPTSPAPASVAVRFWGIVAGCRVVLAVSAQAGIAIIGTTAGSTGSAISTTGLPRPPAKTPRR